MTRRYDPVDIEALAVPLPKGTTFVPKAGGSVFSEKLASAHDVLAAQSPADETGALDHAARIARSGARTIRRHPWLAGTALLASLALHVGASAIFVEPPTEISVEGGAPVDIAVLGSAFEDSQSAGEDVEEPDVTETEEPDQTTPPDQPTETPPEVTERSETATETAEIVPLEPDAVPVIEADETPPEEPEREVSEPEAVAEAEPEESLEAEPVTPQALPDEPVEAIEDAEPVEETETAEVEPAETAEAEPMETVEPLPDPIEDPPVPTPRPEQLPPPVQRAEPQPQPQPARPAAGSQGQQTADQRRGATDGQVQGNAAQSSQTSGQASQAGNAATSNYPGRVVAKLRRSLRYPPEARRDGLSGTAQVRFTVSANGGVSGIGVVRSSGSPVLDRAAIQTVQRAGPFPGIPAAAGRSSWTFTVPLAFTR